VGLSSKPVILVVDDEETPLVLRKLVLQKAGYEVLTARSATEALQIAGSRDLNLVITDHLMPGITGVELAQQIKSRFPELRVVLLSGVNDIPAGSDLADLFVSKVEGPERLCQQISAVLHGAGAGAGSEEDSASL
jgi:CheY-like chemotaxis protein